MYFFRFHPWDQMENGSDRCQECKQNNTTKIMDKVIFE
jgi:hypothetical protein